MFSCSVRFLTGHSRKGGVDPLFVAEQAADPDSTLVVYMGLSTLPSLATKLISNGLPADTPAAAIERGTTVYQRTVIHSAPICCISLCDSYIDDVLVKSPAHTPLDVRYQGRLLLKSCCHRLRFKLLSLAIVCDKQLPMRPPLYKKENVVAVLSPRKRNSLNLLVLFLLK
jgi:hypothetical protein